MYNDFNGSNSEYEAEDTYLSKLSAPSKQFISRLASFQGGHLPAASRSHTKP
jgi:hypothetical protein